MTPSRIARILSPRPPSFVSITVADLLREAASEQPDRCALVFWEGGPRVRWSYRDLLEKSEAVARRLAASFVPGERLAVWAYNCAEWLPLQYGAAMAGLTLVAVSPASTARELSYILSQSQSSGLVYGIWTKTGDRAAMAQAARQDIASLQHVFALETLVEEVAGESSSAALPAVDPASIAMIQYTSGTTGMPKGAMLTHAGLTNTTRASEAALALEPGSVRLNGVPMYNTAGSVLCSMNTLWNRGTHVMLRQFDATQVLDAIEAEKVNWVPLVPTMAIAVMDHPRCASADLASLEIVQTGGAPIAPELVARIEADLAADCVVVFGMTETSSVLCMTDRHDTLEHRTQTIGYPLAGIEVEIRNVATGETASIGEIGEIMMRGHSVTPGYFNMPEATAKAIDRDGWLHSGDLGLIREDGYLEIRGRLKEMIIKGGSNIYPREIEDALAEHPGIELTAVFGLPDAKYGEIVAAAVIARPDAAPTLQEFRAFLDERLSSFKIPSAFYRVDEMPMSPMGKIQKHVLVEMASSGSLSPW